MKSMRSARGGKHIQTQRGRQWLELQAAGAGKKLIGRLARGGSGGSLLRGGRVESVSDRRKRRQHQRAELEGSGTEAGSRRSVDLRKGLVHGGLGQDSAQRLSSREAMLCCAVLSCRRYSNLARRPKRVYRRALKAKRAIFVT